MDTARLRNTLACTGALRARGSRPVSWPERLLQSFAAPTYPLQSMPLGDALVLFVAELAPVTHRSTEQIRDFIQTATSQIVDPAHMPLVLSHVGVLAQWRDVHPARLEAEDLPALCHLKSGGFVVVVRARPADFHVRTATSIARVSRVALTAQVELRILQAA